MLLTHICLLFLRLCSSSKGCCHSCTSSSQTQQTSAPRIFRTVLIFQFRSLLIWPDYYLLPLEVKQGLDRLWLTSLDTRSQIWITDWYLIHLEYWVFLPSYICGFPVLFAFSLNVRFFPFHSADTPSANGI